MDEVNAELPKQARGLYAKFNVSRTDGDPNGKHEGCAYFVLDPQHDPMARAALVAYADEAHRSGYHQLANDLGRWLRRIERHGQ